MKFSIEDFFSKSGSVLSKKNPDQTVITKLHPKGKKLKELHIYFQMFTSFVWSKDFKFINKHVICYNIHQKLLPKQQMQKSKLALPETMTR